MSRRGGNEPSSENRKNPPAAPVKSGMKLKKSPKKLNKNQSVPNDELSRLAFEKLHKEYQLIDEYQLEEDVLPSTSRPPIPPSASELDGHSWTKNIHTTGANANGAKRHGSRPVQGHTVKPSTLDSFSQATSADPIPDSATFFEELPIASNNDFELANESTQSRLTLTQSVPTHSASVRSFPSSAGMEVDVPFSDSLGSVSTQRSARAGRELRRLFEPSLQSASELDHTSSSSHISTYNASKPNMPAPTADSSTPTPRRSARLSLGPR